MATGTRLAASAGWYTLASAPGVIAVALATAWIYGQYTEFDRPSVGTALPFVAMGGLWCAAAAIVVLTPQRRHAVVTVGGSVAACALSAGVVAIAAPKSPLGQGAAVLVVAVALPVVVWTVASWPGTVVAIVRLVVAAIGLAVGVPAALVLLLVAVSRGFTIAGAAAAATIVVHAPVTFLSSLVHGDLSAEETADRDVPGADAPRSRGFVAVAPVVALSALLGLGGVAAKPSAPAESDPVLAEVAAAHRDINAAVGWGSWRPGALDDTASTLERAVAIGGGDVPELADAAARVRRAVEENDRDSAVIAHRIVAGFELKVRDARAFLNDA